MLLAMILADYIVQFHPYSKVEADINIGSFKASLVSDDNTRLKYSRDRNVLRIVTNSHIPLDMVDTIQTRPVWNLDRIDQRKGYDKVYRYDDRAGVDVSAYILDTGINTKHQEFVGRTVFSFDSTGEGLFDKVGHGSHIAGIIGGRTFGVAKKVELVAVKVLGEKGGTEYGILKGLEWAVNDMKRRNRKAVANMSIAAPNLKALNDGVRAAIAAGLTIVASAGNKNEDACTQSPASIDEVITVGATDSKDKRTDFSNWGRCVDIFAPGLDITSADADTNYGSTDMSGTSMSAPHVTGVAALYLSMNIKNVKTAIVNSGSPVVNTNNVQSTTNRLVFNNPQ